MVKLQRNSLNKFTQSRSFLYLLFYIKDNTLNVCSTDLNKSLAKISSISLSNFFFYIHLSLVHSCHWCAMWLMWLMCLYCQPAPLSLYVWVTGSFWRSSCTVECNKIWRKFVFFFLFFIIIILSPALKSNCQSFLKKLVCHKTRKLPQATGRQVWG